MHVASCKIKQNDDVLIPFGSFCQLANYVHLDMAKRFRDYKNFGERRRRYELTGFACHLSNVALPYKLGYMRFNIRQILVM